MTVIRRKVHTYNNPTSNNASDTESLNLGSAATSDSESLHNEPSTLQQVRFTTGLKLDDAISSKCRVLGKRKQRRYLNRSLLQTLSEEDEDSNNYIKFYNDHKTPLTRLLEDESALDFWNDFINRTEEEQDQLLGFSTAEDKKDDVPNTKEIHSQICYKIRRMIKIKKKLPIELIQKTEESLLDFLNTSSDGVYVSTPNTSFERLLLHGIAQYHGLSSISILMDNSRSVEVFRTKTDWAPSSLPFCKFVEELRR